MLQLSVDEKLKIYSSRNSITPVSFRDIEDQIGVDHSTIHAMFPKIESEIKVALQPPQISKKKFQVIIVLTLSLVGQMSSRPMQAAIKIIFGIHIGHGTILKILKESGDIAREVLSKELNLSSVKTASFDEIFQSQTPMLGFVDNKSAAIFFKKADDRSSKSWHELLELLTSIGLEPSSVITDGGSGLKKSLHLKFGSSVIYVLDLFHFLKKLREAKNKMEGICYSLILRVDKLIEINIDKRKSEYLKAIKKMDNAITLFDDYEKLLKAVSGHVYLANGSEEYVNSSVLLNEFKDLAAYLKEFNLKIRKHRKINEARSYLENNLEELSSYKFNIENDIKNKFNDNSSLVLNYIVPIVEYHDQFERSYEDKKSQHFWANKIIETKNTALTYVDEKDFDKILNEVAGIISKYAKSNSLIENINNQVRRFLDTYKTVPTWFCDLFSLYWNFRKLKRGKRSGFAPVELLTGKQMKKDWIELITEKFPYHKLQIIN